MGEAVYLVMVLQTGNSYRLEGPDTPLLFPKELAGVMPVYKTYEEAEKFSQGRYKIVPVAAKVGD